ncbi:Pleckstrin-likey domain-containing family G member 5 [Papilio xuthus]|uniref:Pleckstrin-likey domain-containing family G member 5 n=1 Tax=Papilio xuthus TaxID=66420 RepID=A0A194PGI5_PAPXU|nr:Pleckstrin-likey domain-containing family G member 5 [Papilio xuthus]
MDKSKHKTGKKMDKNNGKEKSPLFVSDVKNLKENLKIKEILRTVKMNSSMRLKSPQSSKTVNNKDLNDNHDCFESASQELQEHMVDETNPSATNHNVITSTLNVDTETSDNDLQKNEGIKVTIYEVSDCTESNDSSQSNTISQNCSDSKESNINDEKTEMNNIDTKVTSSPKPTNNVATLKPRDRKLSLDQTILSRRSGLSQSELDLNLIGKSPLERKSSFFRKKMDNFLKNTTEIFKRQSQSVKSQPTQRRGSKSISLQSLNDKSYPSNGYNNDGTLQIPQDIRNSATSLSTMARSSSVASSISPEGVEQDSPSGSQTVLFASQPLGDYSSNSVNNLNEPYVQDSLLKSRAISMSSGLDAPQGRLRRKASKSNRVTWLASEGLTNYFKRVMQDEKSREVQSCHSYQDFSIIPEHASYGPATDSKGRRLSYQRAVSGEDPVLPTRYFDSSQRRKNFIPEHQVNLRLDLKKDVGGLEEEWSFAQVVGAIKPPNETSKLPTIGGAELDYARVLVGVSSNAALLPPTLARLMKSNFVATDGDKNLFYIDSGQGLLILWVKGTSTTSLGVVPPTIEVTKEQTPSPPKDEGAFNKNICSVVRNRTISESQNVVYAEQETDELIAMLRETESLDEQGDILQYLVDSQGLDFNTARFQLNLWCIKTYVYREHNLTIQQMSNTKATDPNFELEAKLDDFTLHGVPPLHGFAAVTLPDQSLEYLHWAERPDEMHQYYAKCNLPPSEESRQAVIRELVNTEADYIRHLKSLVEVFMAAAHALQESNFMLDVDTQRLFSNIPDLYNASLEFWDATFYPMILESVETGGPLNPELMYEGFHNIDEYLQSYEIYLMDQSRAVEYLRSLSSNTEFMSYLSWCHKQKEINRLQLADMLAKPMQRITKYSLIINRIHHYTEKDTARELIISMETTVKSFVQNINRCIRQREEKDKITTLANSIDAYELEFKDEEMERCYKLYCQLDLQAPMLHSFLDVIRCLVFSGDLRFKDNINKEARKKTTESCIDVCVFLFTDMMLICKKMPKGSPYKYKMIRPKYMLDRLHFYPKYKSGTKDVVSLIFVAVDDFHSSYHSFTLSESSKEEKNQMALKTSLLQTWDHKIKEAKISYELVIIYGQRKEGVPESAEDSLKMRRMTPEEVAIEKEAREWAAIMLHGRMTRDREYDMMNIPEDPYQITEAILAGNIDAARRWRNPFLRRYSSTTAGSSRTSRMSSLQKSASATSRDDPQPSTSRGLYCPSDSIEIPFEKLESEDTFNDDISDDEDAESPLPSSLLPPPYVSPQISRSPVLQPPALQQPVIRTGVIHQLALQPSMIHEAIIRGPTIQEPIMPQSMMEDEIPSLMVEPLNQPPVIVEPVRVSIVEGPPLRSVAISNPVAQSTANRVYCNPRPPSEPQITQEPKSQHSITQQSVAVGIPIPIPVPFPLLPSLRGDAAVLGRDADDSKGKKGRRIHVPRAESVQSNRSAHIQHVQRSKSVQSAHSTQFVQHAERAQSAMSDYSAKSSQSERAGHRRNGRGRRGKRAASASPSTLRVIPPGDGMASMLSLPDLTVEPPTPRHPPRSRRSRSGATTGNVTSNTTGVSEETENTQETGTLPDSEDLGVTAACEFMTDPHDIRKEILEIVAQYSEALHLDDIERDPIQTLDDLQPENNVEDTKEIVLQNVTKQKIPQDDTNENFQQDECGEEHIPGEVELKDLVISNQMIEGEAAFLDDLEFMDEEPQDDDDDEEE